ncbi:hypothetical protein CKO44_15750 [Rubrivivax gelatinosus]|uniref:hypothetical protein n=1 Tax=Rubrivivax gelatinosus TaxID=28068 RepID=UPI0019084B7D|nr:hypothetical protein [Rubrivivax gelatinosus]MBK1614923.1 hypothetical protein [Rubrivivax gelatinosus]MBZ8142942.1 hypothetical protein [Rubrivivax gelatinosus]
MDGKSAVQLIERLMAEGQAAVLAVIAGREREAITEIFRTLDMCAYAFRMAPNQMDLVRQDVARHLMLMGAAPALQPLLAKVVASSGPMRWSPSYAPFTDYMDHYLWRCGALHSLHRLTCLERYGLSRVRFEGDRRVVIEVEHGGAEAADRDSQHWWNALQLEAAGALEPLSAAQLERIRQRLDERSGTAYGWFISYVQDEELIDRGLRRVRQLELSWPEATALPDEAVVGGRTFRQWKDACGFAAAQALAHLEFCTRLRATQKGLDLRNLMTRCRARNDIVEEWHAAGYAPTWTDMTIRSLTLDERSSLGWISRYDTPFPFYVGIGPDFALAPSMSALMNPFVGMVRHLREQYRRDWDKALNSREDQLRKEIAALLPTPRFSVATSGVELKRPNGSVLTDIDAAILDSLHGTVALLQIKWHDVFSRSLRERESRRINMLAAQQWVDKIHGWVADRDSASVAHAIGFKNLTRGPSGPPVLVVMTRHAARFSGEASGDRRSAWVSWPQFARTIRECSPDADALRIVATRHTPSESTTVVTPLDQPPIKMRYHFDGVEFEVVRGGSTLSATQA